MARTLTLGAAAALSLTLLAGDGPHATAILTRDSLVDGLTTPEGGPLVQYRAVRRLSASTRGGKMSAQLVAATTFDQGVFRWDVTSETGSSLIRGRVLRAALEAEQEAQTAERREQAALSRANYEFLELVAEEQLLRLAMKPKRKHPMLVDGAVFFDRASADLVRVEGELSKRPSFWTRKTQITRDYARIGGVRVPVSMRSKADVLFAGESSFEMAYEYVEINGVPVSN